MPVAACDRCRKTIRLKKADAGAPSYCPSCKEELDAAGAAPVECGVKVGTHLSIRTLPSSDKFASALPDDLMAPNIRRPRRPSDAGTAVIVLVVLSLLAALIVSLPRLFRPPAAPPAAPLLGVPPSAASAPPAAPPLVVQHVDAGDRAQPPTPAPPAVEEPRGAAGRFRAKLKSLEWLTGPAEHLTFSADFRRAAFVSRRYIVEVWDVNDEKELARFAGAFRSAVFSPDGSKMLFDDGYGVVRLWEPTTRTTPPELHGDQAAVISLCFSPDATLALIGREATPHGPTTMQLWDLKTGQEVTEPEEWDAAWVQVGLATVPEPTPPPFLKDARPAVTTTQTIVAPSAPVEGEVVVERPAYLLTTTTGSHKTYEIIEVDGGR